MNSYQPLVKHAKLAAVAAAVAATLSAGAQQREPARENANRQQAEQSTQIARSDAGMQTLERYLATKTLRVSKLVGMEVQTRSGDNLGEVHEVARAAGPGQDMQLIVQVGGIGEPEKLVAFGFDEIQINSDGDELFANRTREQLAAAPAVILDQRSAGSGAAAPRSADGDRGAAPAVPGASQPRSTAPATSSSAATASLASQRVADLVGAEIIGSSGDQVGEVDDIVISTAGADGVRAVLQVGGIAGVGEKRVALPLSQLTVERAADGSPTLRAAMTQEALERLPEFEYEEQRSAL